MATKENFLQKVKEGYSFKGDSLEKDGIVINKFEVN
jgi:hypothetical protein